MTGRRLLYTLSLCLAWGGISVVSHISGILQGSWHWGLNALLSALFDGFAVMLCVVVADRVSDASMHRWWPYPPAVLVGVAIGTASLWILSQRLLGLSTAYGTRGTVEPFLTFAFRHGLHGLVVWSLATLAYVSWRRATQRLAALRAIQLERAAAQRQVLKSRLAVMQARVEPKFLLGALARVESLYEIDNYAGDCMLKDLVTYLRTAIPQIRDPTSSLAREIGLANAYLNVVSAQARERALVCDSSTELDDAHMPPMMLLPLISHALAHRNGHEVGDECLKISAAVHDDRLRVTIADSGSGFAPEAESAGPMEEIRDRLATLYGEYATITLRAHAHGSEAAIEIPYEPCHAT